MAAVLAYKFRQLGGGDVVCFSGWGAVGSEGSGGDTDEDFGRGGGGGGEEGFPLVVVECCVAVEWKRAGIGIVIVVIELWPEIIEFRILDNGPHVRLWKRTLRCPGNVIFMCGIGREV